MNTQPTFTSKPSEPQVTENRQEHDEPCISEHVRKFLEKRGTTMSELLRKARRRNTRHRPPMGVCEKVCWRWFRDKIDIKVERNNGYVALLKFSDGDTVEVLRNDYNLTREDFLDLYRAGDVFNAFNSGLKEGFRTLLRHFIANRMTNTLAMLDKVFEWLGFPTDEIS